MSRTDKQLKNLRDLLFLAVVYIGAGKFGLSFAFFNQSASPVWPPTGLSLAAMILFGYRVWPSIFLGAFLVNVTTAGNFATSIGIALGNTLEAFAGAWLVERFANGRRAFDRVGDLLRFSALAGLVATAVSPTIGLASLALGGFLPAGTGGMVWLTWWLGDMGGALIIAPLIIIWSRSWTMSWASSHAVEAISLICTLVIVSGSVFGPIAFPPTRHYAIDFLCVSVVLWSAFRFGMRETALVTFILMIFAVSGTLAGFGPFITSERNESLLVLQLFLCFTSVIGLAVAVAAEALRRRTEELAESDRRKDEFIAMLSHELRNPLSTIATAVQLADRGGHSVSVVSLHQTVLRQVKHLARLIDDLLDVSRITRGKIGLRKEPCRVANAVRHAVESVRPAIEGKKQRLSVDFGSDAATVDADPTRLDQIFVNLLTNASKYTDRGGEISVSLVQSGGFAEVSIRDSGMGIEPEMMSRVFDLFTQADRSLDRSQGGLGIGLTLVKRLAEIHGGSVKVASGGLGQGSVFTVRLPEIEPVAAAPCEQVRERCAVPPCRILIVDDNELSASMLGTLLEDEGHSVLIAKDGAEALELAASHLPEVVLLDIGLPCMDGYEVAARLRTNEKIKHSLVIAISGYGREQDLSRSKESGFDHHLVKPIDYDVLMELLSDRVRTAGFFT